MDRLQPLRCPGLLNTGSSSLNALERLKPNDPLLLAKQRNLWMLTNLDDTPVCRLAEKFAPPKYAKFLSGCVHAIVQRFRADSSDEFEVHLIRDAWSAVLPELVFEPATS